MDMTMLVAPSASAWHVLAELAVCGQDNLLLADAGRLASRIADAFQKRLLCPWGLLVLHNVGVAPAVASWGLDPERQRDLLHRNGNTPSALPHTVELHLAHEGEPAGTLLLGVGPQSDNVLTPVLADALRHQLDLLIALHRREAAQRDERARQQQRARELFVLYENSQIISLKLGIETVLARLAENITLAMDADRCALHLLDQRNPTVLYEAATYSTDGSDDPANLRYDRTRFRVVDDILRSGDPVVVEDAAFERNESVLALLRQFGFRSLLLLPLCARGEALGILIVSYSEHPHRFSGVDLNLARTLASQVATTVLNALLADAKQQHTGELSTLQTISQQLAADLALEDALDVLLNGVCVLVPFAGAQISLYEPQAQMLRVAAQRGVVAPEYSEATATQLSEGLNGWVARYRRTLRLEDMQQPPVRPTLPALTSGLPVQSYLGVPLLVGEQLVGTLELFGEQVNVFSAIDQRLLMIVAGQAARVFVSTQMQVQTDEHLRRRMEQLTALQRISRQLTATLSLDRILKFALEEALQATVATQGYIALRAGTKDDLRIEDSKTTVLRGYVALGEGSSTDRFQVVAAAGYDDPANRAILGRTLRDAPTVAMLALANGEPGLADELTSDDRVDGMGPVVASALALPIFYEEHIIGVVNLHSQIIHAFDHDAIEFGRALAEHLALAIGNAQRYDDQRHQRELLQKRSVLLGEVMGIGEALRTEFVLQDVLERIAFSAVEAAGYGVVVINLVDPQAPDVMTPVVAAGVPLADFAVLRGRSLPVSLVLRFFERRFRVGRGFFIPGAESRAIIDEYGAEYLASFQTAFHENRPAHEWQSDDMFLLPLYNTQAALIGVISVDNPYDRQRPTLRSVEPLEIFADQAAIAIENARLLEEARQQADQMSALYRVGKAAASTLDLDNLLERVYAEIVAYMGVPSFFFVSSYEGASNTMRFELFKEEGRELALFSKKTLPKGGLSGWVIDHGVALDLHDMLLERDQVPAPLVALGKDVRSWIGIPLRSHNQIIGVLSVQHVEPHMFNARHMRFLSSLSNQLAIALENVRLFNDTRRRLGELETFNQIGQELNAASRLEELSELLYRQTSRLLDTTNFYIALYDEHQGTVTFPLYYEHGERMPVEPVTALDSLTHYVIRTREPLLLQGPDKAAQTRARGIRPISERARSWLGVPMIVADRVIGLIAIEDDERDAAYSKDDVRLLATIASWGATAFENARLLGESRQSVQDLTALNDISAALSGTLDATEIVRIAASSALELLKAQTCVLVRFDEQRRPMQQFAIDLDQPEMLDMPVVPGISPFIQRLLHHDRPMAITDLRSVLPEDAAVVQLGLRGSVAEIIGSREQPAGAILIASREPREWQEREIALLSILANQTGKALESARLFESEQARREVADTLREVAQTLTSLMALDDILSLVLDQLARVVRYDSAALMLREGDQMRIVALRGFTSAAVKNLRFSLNDDLTLQQIVQTRRPLVIADAQDSPYFISEEGSEHIRGWIGAPLLLDDEVIGLLTVDSSTVGAYTEEDANLAFALTSQAAQAIRNARLFDAVRAAERDLKRRVDERTIELAAANTQLREEKERLQAVHEITLDLTESLDLNEILVKTLTLASKAVGARRGSIMLRNLPDGALICQAVLGGDGGVHIIENPITFSEGQGLAGWVIEHQQPVVIGDVRVDGRWVYEEGRADEVRSVVAVPLMAQDGALGVLILRSPEVDFFRESQVQLLVTIASEVAIVINNANLFSLITNIATEKSELLRKQQEETSRSQAILEGLGEGVLVLDEQQRIIMFNMAAEQILDIPAVHMLGHSLDDLRIYGSNDETRKRSATLYDGFDQALQALVAQSKPHTLVIELPSPNQSIVINVGSVHGPNDVLYGRVVVLRDITREIESDRAKRDFISSVSHELRTPLTAIKGYVDLMMLGTVGSLSEGQSSFLGVVKNNTKRLMDLIDDLLEIGRIDANKIDLSFGCVDVPEVISDVLQTLRAEVDRKSLTIKVEIANGLPTIEADVRRLTQVVMNLLSNAVKYTFARGTITVRAALNPAGLLEVAVQDTGVGISPEQQQHLFRRFYRADNPLRDEAGGTGLGLSIAKSFVEMHGGEMWVRSESGKGSTFSFVVPVVQPEPALSVSEG